MNHFHRDRGFALLLTLVLVLIAGVALAMTARRSTDEALQTREATEQLQRKWAQVSCRSTLLPRAEGLLVQAERARHDAEGQAVTSKRSDEPLNQIRITCVLAGIDMTLILTDEQAKYNPTAMMQLSDAASVRSDLRSMLRRSRRGDPDALEIQLRPMLGLGLDGSADESIKDDALPTARFGGYGQLFNPAKPDALLGSERSPGIATRVTCWGDGRLNLRRAPDAVVRRVLGPVLGDEGTLGLIRVREQMPAMPIRDWFNALTDSDPSASTLAQAMVVEQSNCHGLWVIAEDRGRTWTSFSVRIVQSAGQVNVVDQKPIETAKSERATVEQAPHDPVQRYDFAW